jgi:TPR repeat protein
VIAVPNPPAEPIVKLPPPIAPGTDKNQLVAPHHDALATVTIENHGAADTKAAVTAAPSEKSDVELEAEARAARIKAERKRLNHNALIWQEERAAAGSATAQRSLAMRYLTGDGVEKDEIKGMDLLRKGAAGGDSAAKKELAKREPAKKE